MRITAQGWRRDSGPKTICDVLVSDGQQSIGNSYKKDVLYIENAQKGITLVLINEGQDASAVKGFLTALGIDRPSLLDSDLTVGRAYGLSALPMTVFVRADGTIDRRQVGQLAERVLASELSVLGSQ